MKHVIGDAANILFITDEDDSFLNQIDIDNIQNQCTTNFTVDINHLLHPKQMDHDINMSGNYNHF